MSQEPIGRHREWLWAMEQARKLARTKFPVFIQGATGVGKEVVAEYIHEHSHARPEIFVAVNCAALTETVLEAELFGVEGGVPGFGVRQSSTGYLKAAHGGTLFLDEIADLPPSAQAKLLRVLETGTFRRVCGPREVKVDVRIIAAAQLSADELARRGHFRPDFFQRISGFDVVLPSLAERRSDIPILAEYFRSCCCPKLRIGSEAMDFLMAYPFPGNVRELRRFFQYASVFCEGEEILPENFSRRLPVPAATDPRETVLRMLTARERLTTRDLVRRLDLPRSRAQALLSELVRAGQITRHGQGRATHYRLP